MQGVHIWPLVGELGCHMLYGSAKRILKQNKNHSDFENYNLFVKKSFYFVLGYSRLTMLW